MTTLAAALSRPLSIDLRRFLVTNWREAAVATGLGVSPFVESYHSSALVLFAAAALYAPALLGRASYSRWVWALAAIIGISILGAVLLADSTLAAALFALWYVLVGGVFIARESTRVLWWLPFVAYANVGAMVYQSATTDVVRAGGFIFNVNAASGLLTICAVVLLSNKKTQWLAVPLLAAIPLTGSRLALVVATAMLGVLFARGALRWPQVGGIVAATFLLTMPFWAVMQPALRIAVPATEAPQVERAATSVALTTNKAIQDTAVRTTFQVHSPEQGLVPAQPGAGVSVLPKGPLQNSLQHFTPLRVGAEGGLFAMIAWLALAGAALLRRRGSAAWYALVAAVGLTTLDYYFWSPSGLIAVWWLLLAIQLRRGEA